MHLVGPSIPSAVECGLMHERSLGTAVNRVLSATTELRSFHYALDMRYQHTQCPSSTPTTAVDQQFMCFGPQWVPARSKASRADPAGPRMARAGSSPWGHPFQACAMPCGLPFGCLSFKWAVVVWRGNHSNKEVLSYTITSLNTAVWKGTGLTPFTPTAACCSQRCHVSLVIDNHNAKRNTHTHTLAATADKQKPHTL
ncbi:uncharacterized protein MYCFIDRAFT_212110 [Pseudocercospora fijiensis CIRAD86]|uniref:Uncharacterized protein n=1 Tax=Pseudocercospora fijiensis (strain CIRAD86) TaxID=383855 RepID=M2ZIR6_PSEFD|nr:uncharacterized protein MYCFIDRAFT_212110 [Pseudocercospora fijiensis CIRAD86]EME79009.1 hypothetical protein MYCFIDRAFT_212110 [Pseudocercospora fijiensis CIRAD86]